MRRLVQRIRELGLGAKVASGAALVAALTGYATLVANVEAFQAAKEWVGDYPVPSLAVLTAAIVVDDLRRKFGKDASTSERQLHKSEEEQRVKYLAFISASSGEESFYSLIFNHLVQSARALSDAGTRLILIPWFPKRSFDIGKELRDDVRALQRINNFQFSGIFIIPDEPDADVDDLRLLCEVSPNIIVLDVNFDPDAAPGDWRPFFVGGDEVRGAEMAANIVVDYLTSAAIQDPRVLIVRGRSTKWESQRYLVFQDSVARALSSATVVLSHIEAEYSRSKAREYVLGQLRRDASKTRLPHLIFACNDDMAIGAHDAIRRLIREGVFDEERAPRIVGYDGIREMIDLIDAGDNLMIGTVEVSIKHLSDHAMESMKRLIEGGVPIHRPPQMKSIYAKVHPSPSKDGGL